MDADTFYKTLKSDQEAFVKIRHKQVELQTAAGRPNQVLDLADRVQVRGFLRG